ncbi:MAG: hypothetical protein AB9917_10700 [Negativicutes bacterium]
MITINLDADIHNADWTKRTWDLPYKSEEELQEGLGDRYESFKKLPAYQIRPWASHNKNYIDYYDLENYLFDIVRPRFIEDGKLSAFDFFCIIIWKANRAKSNIARRLLKCGYHSLEEAVSALTRELAQSVTPKDKMNCLHKWGFMLPMSSAILTILYPDTFTIYDYRVCDMLGDCHKLTNITSFEKLWLGYEDYKQKVINISPKELSLRDKDRYLWGKSFYRDLMNDISAGFAK